MPKHVNMNIRRPVKQQVATKQNVQHAYGKYFLAIHLVPKYVNMNMRRPVKQQVAMHQTECTTWKKKNFLQENSVPISKF